VKQQQNKLDKDCSLHACGHLRLVSLYTCSDTIVWLRIKH